MGDSSAVTAEATLSDDRPQSGAARPWLAQAWRHTLSRMGARLGFFWIIVVGLTAVLAPVLANSFPLLAKRDGSISSPMVEHLSGADVLLLILTIAYGVTLLFRGMRFSQRVMIVLWVLMVGGPLVFWPELVSIGSEALGVRAGGVDSTAASGLGRTASWILLVFMAFDLAVAVWLFLRAPMGKIARWVVLGVMLGLGVFLAFHPVQPSGRVVYDEYRVLQKEGRLEWVVWAPIPYSPGDRLFDQFDPEHPHPWAPSWWSSSSAQGGHLLGTNEFKADIFSHMIHACRIAMAVGFISTGLSILIGIFIGGMMGYFVGLVDLFGMRLVEIFGAVPTIYLLLTFIAAFPDYRSIYLIMAIIGLTSWVGDARFVRAEFLRLRHQDFVQAAIAAGLPLHRVLFRHLLPNALAPLLVSASFGVAGAVLAESTLSFLGLGVPVGDASWGALLSQAVKASGGFYWWLAIFPGLAIFLTVFAYNLIGEALRDALDPKLQGGD